MAKDGTIKINTELDSSKAQSAMAKFSGTAKNALKGITVAAGAAGTAITAMAGYAVKVGSDFEAGMSKVSAISGAAGADFEKLSDKAKEYMYLICMNAGCMPVGFFEVAHGTCHAAVVGMREIFVRTLLCGASDIVVVHNHPGGDGADTGGGGTAGSPVLRPYHYSAGRLFQLFGGEEDGQEK